jgi:hypothetical protein
MIVYLSIFIVISFLHFLSWRIKALRPGVLLISILLLWLVSSLRDVTVGIDTKNYLALFESIVQNGLMIQDVSVINLFVPNGFELGFTIYTYFVSLFTSSFITYLFITGVLVYVPIYLFIKRYSTDYYLSLVIYYCLFFFGSMTLLRQSIAMSILLIGTKYIVGRNPIKFTAIVLLASSFHVSALVGLVLYPIYNRSLTRFAATLILSLATIVFAFMSALVELAATINHRYEFYLDRIDSFSIASFLSLGLYLFIFVIMVLLRDKKLDGYKDSIRQDFLIIVSFAAMVVMALSIKVNSLDRLALVFLIYTVISLPILLTSNKGAAKTKHIKLLLVILFISYAATILLIRPEWYGVSDYKLSGGV